MIHGDIVNTLWPSWLTSLPSEFRSAGYGRLKADQWHVLGTIFLPVSLVHLWSVVEAGNPHFERCHQILDVTMLLLSAVATACSQVTSANHAQLYLSSMHSYLRGLKALFPDYSLHPNHHMALHLPEYLLLYSPVHSWWTFPFEQLIGILQRISTNYKIGKFYNLIFSSIISWSWILRWIQGNYLLIFHMICCFEEPHPQSWHPWSNQKLWANF